MQLISYCEPRNVMLVHGEAHKMEFLKEKIRQVCVVACILMRNVTKNPNISSNYVIKMRAFY